MTIVPPEPGEPRRPLGPLNPGDAWVVADSGERYWGRFGAAGVLAVDAERGVLLQHRVGWSHFGGTWGIPGGARHQDESALDGALREAREEAGIPEGALRPRFSDVLDLSIWTYTTVVADVVEPFDPVISDPESVALEWVQVAEVAQRALHPGFADSWGRLSALLSLRPAIVVDAANVVGSVPDGWWKDRAGAAARLYARVSAWATAGVAAAELGLSADRWHPEVSFVVEGQARGMAEVGGVEVVRAQGSGDDAIVAEAVRLVGEGRTVKVVTSDRGLRERAEAAGADVASAGWLLAQLPAS
ncbi:NUDIX domain-containing protein [Microbacterium bovistercoris]|uniref:NUDIX domain-containing protein n=1 Tax=Microbacterium bovistercoris TaxID=2293570 RepID=A0A371NRA1_9MICO|nr:NUDIX hydrolase [Microbacterium bovistercoris]REJ04676.1 NUDIX domain-containing protein [Microbacterium bovistercoris]